MPAQSYSGLSTTEAQNKLKEFGFNELVDVNKSTPLQILFRQVKHNFVVYMLVVAAIFSFFVGKTVTGYTILVVVTVVIFVGFIQEFKADQSIKALKSMIMPVSFVFRDGRKVEVSSRELVPGDIVILGMGEKIPADCKVLEQQHLRVNESSLTGESKEISKVEHTGGDIKDENRIFMGTFIVNGRCVAKVKHTGMNTSFGKVAGLISSAEKELPLQDKVNNISKYMVTVAIVISLATGLIMLTRAQGLNSEVVINILILMVALSVSAFPEGFPVVLITTLATGASRMSKRNALVNRMSIIETLGETTVICTDKTGTLTRGEMTVKFIFTGNGLYSVEGTGYVATGNILDNDRAVDIYKDPALENLIKCSVLCNDSDIERTGIDNEYRAKGTPTEAALLVLGAKVNTFKDSIKGVREGENPFNSDRKMMSVLFDSDGRHMVFAKGAPEILIEKCDHVFKKDSIVRMSQEERAKIEEMGVEMSKNAYRTLVLVYKDLEYSDRDYREDDFVFLGLVAMEDSPREEVPEALALAQDAGVSIKMITGDSKDTAMAIAEQIGLKGELMDGNQIDQLSDEELKIAVSHTVIFARVKPEHKLRIVRALKERGEIVAMTGDGVNDAPALKEAHIGIAMGKNGTDVSRAASDLILRDDNFATIVAAISEGRTVFNNIRKFVTFQLSCNFAELMVLFFGVLFAPLFGWDTPLLLAIQILLMNLVTDNLPALTLGLNPSSKDIMEDKPRKNAEILNKTLIKMIIFTGSLMGIFTLITYYFTFNILDQDIATARTTALVVLIVLEVAAAFSYRSFRKHVLNRSPFVNNFLVYASLLSLLITVLVVYFHPLQRVFETVPIKPIDWIIALVAGMLSLVIYDYQKTKNIRNKEYIVDTR